MRYSEARTGRVFVIRLETGDRLPDAVERLAGEQGVARGFLVVLGGAEAGAVRPRPRATRFSRRVSARPRT